jgi:hypothetical protein
MLLEGGFAGVHGSTIEHDREEQGDERRGRFGYRARSPAALTGVGDGRGCCTQVDREKRKK